LWKHEEDRHRQGEDEHRIREWERREMELHVRQDSLAGDAGANRRPAVRLLRHATS
jgi:hypothetical protein